MQQAVATLEYKEELIEGGYYNQDSSVNRLIMKHLFKYSNKILYRVKNVTIHGTKYAVGYVLVAYLEEEDLPVFGVIQDILLKPDICNTLFILKPYCTHIFNPHYFSYEVYPLDETLIYKQKELCDYHPLCISKSFSSSSLYVRTKYDICI